MNENSLVVNEINIHDKIYTVRGLQVMLDRDLAEFYFEVSNDEENSLRSKILTSSWMEVDISQNYLQNKYRNFSYE